MFYFAFGSNMDPAQMQRRCPGSRPLGAAWLEHYALRFDGTSQNWSHKAAANVVPDPGGRVWGALYEVTDEHIAGLDKHEPNYQRTTLDVMSDKTGHVQAEVYVRPPRPVGKPSPEYAAAILRGGEENQLPPEYL